MAEMDFGYTGGQNTEPENKEEIKVDIETGKEVKVDENGNPIEDINKGSTETEKEKKEETETKEIPHEYVPGTELEVDGTTYTINDKGDVIDSNGNVFKKAEEVSEWIKTFNVTEEEQGKELTVENVAKALDLEIIDEENKPVKYENTPEGMKAFVTDAIESGRQEVAEATINALYTQFPFIKPMVDYYIANGNSLEGYNETPDRSNIEIDDKNEAQQEAIIKTAWKEDGRKGNVDQYIAYLKSQGVLAQTAKEELEGLVEKDRARKEELERQALAAQEEAQKQATAYWNNVKSIIDSKKIAGYQIPDTIIVEREGKKVSVTSNDFFNYLYRTDKNGVTDYMRDMQNVKPEDQLQDEILRAYLKFTGGSYSDLINMAINEEKVKKLKLQANSRRNSNTMRINPPKKDETKVDPKDFGY